ncbi:MAG: SgcJ/EcaC family oxidoreductase [Candidatus Gracilibacteria bacterium]|jgi:uncharacterized protein (TIGR02246 family)
MSDLQTLATQNIKRWSDSLLTLDPKKVAELYTEDCEFLPTVSGEFKRGQDGAEAYFHHFLEKHPVGQVTEEAVRQLGDNAYSHVGHYNFELDAEAGARKTVEARFTFIWVKDQTGEWKISHHHSSVKPQ